MTYEKGLLRAAEMAESINCASGCKLPSVIASAIRAEASQPDSQPEGVVVPVECEWHLDDEDQGTRAGSCGALWTFTEGGPTDNNMKFCPECGRAAREQK